MGSALGVMVHLGVVALDVWMTDQPIQIDPRHRFLQVAFSFPFLPILIAEILFSIMSLFLWFSLQSAVRHAHEQDLEREHHETTVVTLQRVMALMAEHIATNNNRILSKIEFRRSQGQRTSETIESASRNISSILRILSEISYARPYLMDTGSQEDLLEELKRKMEELQP